MNGYVGVPNSISGSKIDSSTLTIDAVTVLRQRMVLGDDTGTDALAGVINTAPTSGNYGLVVRNIPSGTQTVNGTIIANIGTTNGLLLDATLTGGTGKLRITDGNHDAAVLNQDAVATDYGLAVRVITPETDANLASGVKWINANTTSVIKSSPGKLLRIIINNAGGTTNTAALYDGNPSSGGTQFGTIGLSSNPVSLEYNLNFQTSLYIVTSGGNGECGDITVIYA